MPALVAGYVKAAVDTSRDSQAILGDFLWPDHDGRQTVARLGR
jgi:hypothetical protein